MLHKEGENNGQREESEALVDQGSTAQAAAVSIKVSLARPKSKMYSQTFLSKPLYICKVTSKF